MGHSATIENAVDTRVDTIKRQSILYDALTPSILRLILLPTEKCNFRCTYCYEDFSAGKMSPDVIEGVKNLVRARAVDLKSLYITWFGGEPFAAYDIVKEIMTAAHETAAEHNLEFTAGATTNGYALTHARLCEMEELGMQEYQISLDGDWEWHDRTRRRADGAGTFDKIWKNIVLLNELRCSGKLHKTVALVRIHVHPRNVESVERLVRLICQHLDHRFFTVVFRPIAHLGGPSDDSFDVFDPKGAQWGTLYKKFSEQLAGFIAKEDDMPGVCYAGKANNFVIRSDGSVAKCTVALYSDFNLVGRVRSDGSMELYQDRLDPWFHAFRSMNDEDLVCPLIRLCSQA